MDIYISIIYIYKFDVAHEYLCTDLKTNSTNLEYNIIIKISYIWSSY